MTKDYFDSIIKENLTRLIGDSAFGYELEKNYENYYSKIAFEDFKKEMQQPQYISFYNSYNNGAGNELIEKKGRYGLTPPKMASVASSSRFCYLALRNGPEALGGSGSVEVEYECKIKGITGTAPQLDAYIKNENIFVEVKCHEIFDNHKIQLSTAYWKYIFGDDNDFGLPTATEPIEKEFEIPYSCFGLDKSNTMFDIKQLLCHLMGIASQKDASKDAKLVYLFFKPKAKSPNDSAELDNVFKELENEINIIFNSDPIKNFTNKHHIQLVGVAEYDEIMRPLTKENLIKLSHN